MFGFEGNAKWLKAKIMKIDDYSTSTAGFRSDPLMREAYLRHRMGEALDRLAASDSPARKRRAACWAAAWSRALQIEKLSSGKSMASRI